MRAQPFSAEQKREILALYKTLPVAALARRYECTGDKILRVVDPSYADRRNAQTRAARERRGETHQPRAPKPAIAKPTLSAAKNVAPVVKISANQNHAGGAWAILASINAKKITCDPLAKVNGNHAPRIRNIMNLSDSTCRWPLGEVGRSSFGYCGDVPEQGRVYCGFHTRLAYTSSAQRKQEAEEHARKEREAKRAIMGGY